MRFRPCYLFALLMGGSGGASANCEANWTKGGACAILGDVVHMRSDTPTQVCADCTTCPSTFEAPCAVDNLMCGGERQCNGVNCVFNSIHTCVDTSWNESVKLTADGTCWIRKMVLPFDVVATNFTTDVKRVVVDLVIHRSATIHGAFSVGLCIAGLLVALIGHWFVSATVGGLSFVASLILSVRLVDDLSPVSFSTQCGAVSVFSIAASMLVVAVAIRFVDRAFFAVPIIISAVFTGAVLVSLPYEWTSGEGVELMGRAAFPFWTIVGVCGLVGGLLLWTKRAMILLLSTSVLGAALASFPFSDVIRSISPGIDLPQWNVGLVFGVVFIMGMLVQYRQAKTKRGVTYKGGRGRGRDDVVLP